MFDGTIHYIHKEGDQVWEKENEFHFRHVEGLGNIKGEMVSRWSGIQASLVGENVDFCLREN